MYRIAVLVLALCVPLHVHAYFSPTLYQSTPKRPTLTYEHVSPLRSQEGWPDWIGRLNVLSTLYFGQSFMQLSREHQEVIRTVSEQWPDWIGYPEQE